jgi:hypothetical protein
MIGGSSQRRKEGKRGKKNVKIEGQENKSGLRENMKGQGKKEHGEEGEIRYEKGRRKEEGGWKVKGRGGKEEGGKGRGRWEIWRIQGKDGGKKVI